MLAYVLWHLFGWEKTNMQEHLIVDPDICPNCGEHMIGDGYTLPYHCPNAYEEDWWYEPPDSGPWLCSIDEDNYEEPTEMDEWASFDPDC